MGAEPNWQELGRLVRERRDAMGLRQSDVPSRGGPSLGTVQNIEQAVRSNYAPRTLRQLERALSAPDGWVDRVLDGTATPEDLDPNHRVVRAGVAHASLGGLTNTVKGTGTSASDSLAVRDSATAEVHRALAEDVSPVIVDMPGGHRVEVLGGGMVFGEVKYVRPAVAATHLVARLVEIEDRTAAEEELLEALLTAMKDILNRDRAERQGGEPN